jgi:hypothetical protein
MLQAVVSNVVIGVVDKPEDIGAFTVSVGRLLLSYLSWDTKQLRKRKFDLFDPDAKSYLYQGCLISAFKTALKSEDGTVIITDATIKYEMAVRQES